MGGNRQYAVQNNLGTVDPKDQPLWLKKEDILRLNSRYIPELEKRVAD
jgi:hypothetical protein